MYQICQGRNMGAPGFNFLEHCLLGAWLAARWLFDGCIDFHAPTIKLFDTAVILCGLQLTHQKTH